MTLMQHDFGFLTLAGARFARNRFVGALSLAMLLSPLVAANTATADAWSQKKCTLYGEAWRKVVEWQGREGLGHDFIDGNERFIAGGCSMPAGVCPRSAAELKAADTLSMMAVSQGITGSFLPFGCRG
jgi:hypothetical protein